jgi:hypothetical protein
MRASTSNVRAGPTPAAESHNGSREARPEASTTTSAASKEPSSRYTTHGGSPGPPRRTDSTLTPSRTCTPGIPRTRRRTRCSNKGLLAENTSNCREPEGAQPNSPSQARSPVSKATAPAASISARKPGRSCSTASRPRYRNTCVAAVLAAPRCGVPGRSWSARLSRAPSPTALARRPLRLRTPPPSSHQLSPLAAAPARGHQTSRNHSPPKWEQPVTGATQHAVDCEAAEERARGQISHSPTPHHD